MLLDVTDLSISFKSIYGYAKILDNVSLNIKKGEIVGVVGESGSGKSVTALSILGLLANNASVDGGSIVYAGQDLLQLKEKDIQKLRGKEISMVFQEPMTALNPTMKIGKQLANVIRKHRGVSKKEAMAIAIQSLRDVQIPDPEAVAVKYPFQLSGGMRQRVVIALAMSAPPNLLIADEPTTALDVTVQDEILKLMKKLTEEKGTSILFITHDLGVVSQLCDRVYVMYGGKIVESGLTKEVLYQSKHPYTKGLIESIPENKNKNMPLKVIEGDAFNPKNRPMGCIFYDRCPLRSDQCQSAPPISHFGDNHWAACWEVVK
jgi:peptide/nickel transport system ATP-binding protein